MRSLLIFGERRIGKTSLLTEMVREYEPRPGGISAAFFDCYGMSLPAGSMAKSFFEWVVSKLGSEPLNEPIRRVVGEDFDVLARRLRPDVSLEDALEGLAERIGKASGGRINRLVFFIDEFDRFVEGYLDDRKREVVQLHGSLRQIVQRSRRLALVMAGSGFLRLQTNDYLHPFYGSIDVLELKPFRGETEAGRQAAQTTFLPNSLRSRLCPGERFTAVARRALELTGGHPYFLSMLGYAAAKSWRGHPLTLESLNRIADLMIQNKIDSGTGDIVRAKFYMFTFESLKTLPACDQAVAKLMLVNIARLTSTHRERWRKWELVQEEFIEDTELRTATTVEQRLTALKNLEAEGIIEFNDTKSHVRIRVPLRAAALREDVGTLRHEALNQLRMASGGVAR
jgi:hypothetical protein